MNTHHRLKPKDRSERRARQRERQARERETSERRARERETGARERERRKRDENTGERTSGGGRRAPKNLDARKASHPFLSLHF